ncbi:ABC transporter permease [Dactylosporangium fulvum]|uniref:ABC transporter permease n=2 Tax=Dactylosporangium fulvum TaxID=53359 RepID=A0ABY5W843_9ACTN|nr:ABC transporter permease [Dactylosporangium fulvum]UWP85530.1 ABC transporter permease [Dactylosporangium fulvum]
MAAVWLVRLAILAAAVGGWQLLTTDLRWRLLFGRPTEVVSLVRAWVVDATFWTDTGVTLAETATGYALGVAAAIVLIAVILPFPAVGRFLSPFIAIVNSLPKIALAPVFIVWFGISFQSKIYFIAVAMFFVVFYGVYSGLNNIDQTMVDNLSVMGASGLERVRDVYVPATAGWLISSLRVSVAWALTAAVISEYIASNQGLGHRIALGQQALDPNAVVAGMFMVAVVSLTADRLLTLIDKRFRQWRLS